eukprot:Selendium_serpulae@DN9056_c0_g1_i1.p1
MRITEKLSTRLFTMPQIFLATSVAKKIDKIDEDEVDPQEFLRTNFSSLNLDELSAVEERLPRLYSGLQHYCKWDPQLGHPHEVLMRFIIGFSPLPLCVYERPVSAGESQTRCEELSAAHDVPLCEAHRCKLTFTASNQRCGNRINVSKTNFCTDHMCQFIGCDWCKLPPNLWVVDHRFCRGHVCFKCLELKVANPEPARDDPPRNVCSNHPLCLVGVCRNLVTDKEKDFCDDHEESLCIHFGPQGRCTRTAVSRDKPCCIHHITMWSDWRKKKEME